MIDGAALLLLTLLAPPPVCGPDAGEPQRRALLFELNAARLAASLAPVKPHPAVCAAARRQASQAAARGSTEPEVSAINEMTRRLRRGGYVPHNWIEITLIGGWEVSALDQLRSVNPGWCETAASGDFEHAGIGLAEHDGQPVYALLLALTRRTVEWRQAAPLADLARVRAAVLEAVNTARRERGRPPLKGDPRLDAAAQEHAEDMLRRVYYAHTSPGGKTVAHRVRAAGYGRARMTAENIAKGLFTADEVVRRWLASSGHRRNILSRGANDLGVGVAFGENANGFEVIWVQVFAGDP